jgi:hypothetical protein
LAPRRHRPRNRRNSADVLLEWLGIPKDAAGAPILDHDPETEDEMHDESEDEGYDDESIDEPSDDDEGRRDFEKRYDLEEEKANARARGFFEGDD